MGGWKRPRKQPRRLRNLQKQWKLGKSQGTVGNRVVAIKIRPPRVLCRVLGMSGIGMILVSIGFNGSVRNIKEDLTFSRERFRDHHLNGDFTANSAIMTAPSHSARYVPKNIRIAIFLHAYKEESR